MPYEPWIFFGCLGYHCYFPTIAYGRLFDKGIFDHECWCHDTYQKPRVSMRRVVEAALSGSALNWLNHGEFLSKAISTSSLHSYL